MNQNLAGTYVIGRNLDFSNLSTSGDAYIKGEFTGSFTTKNGDKQFALYGTKVPLFNHLKDATISNVVLKDVSITTGENVGSLAKTSDNAQISNVSAKGSIQASRNIGGLISKATNHTRMENVEFVGRIQAPANTGNESKIGGLVGQLVNSSINKAHVKLDAVVHQRNNNNFEIGGLAGHVNKAVYDTKIDLQNAWSEGTITNTGGGRVAGITSSHWRDGRITNVLSDMKITKGNRVYADDGALGNGWQRSLLSNFYVTERASGTPERSEFTVKTLNEADTRAKIASFDFQRIGEQLPDTYEAINRYTVDYSQVKGADTSKFTAYRNMEKLMPYYNKEELVTLGNQVTGNLATKEIKSLAAMKDGKVNPHDAQGLFVLYADGSHEVFTLSNKTKINDRLEEYHITGTKLVFTPNISALPEQEQAVKEALSSFDLYSQATYDALQRTNHAEDSTKELYLDEDAIRFKNHLDETVKFLLENGGDADKIIKNKTKVALGLMYLDKYYGIKFGDYNTKNLLLTDFYRTGQDIVDSLIQIGGDYTALRGLATANTYQGTISRLTGAATLIDFFTQNRQIFTDFADNDTWFKDAVNGKVVIEERQSTVPELATADYKAYDKLQAAEFINYFLPMLNLKKSQLYVMSNYSTIVFGSRDRKPNGTEASWKESIHRSANAFRDYIDTWYRIAEDKVKSKLVKKRALPIWDGYNHGGWSDKFGRYGQANEFKSLREFFGPIGKWFHNNGVGAYALVGVEDTLVHFIAGDVLDDYGQSIFTHEVTHVYDDSIYLGGYGKREGQGFEAYAQGLLQSPRNGGELGVNLIFTYPNDGTRYYNPSPEQFRSKQDIDRYMKRYTNTLMVLAHAETDALLAENKPELINTWFKKMDKKPFPNPRNDLEKKDQLDWIRDLNDEEKASASAITSINDLVDRNYISQRWAPGNHTYNGRGINYDTYVTPHMMANIYGGNTSEGSAGAVSFKSNAIYMWGYYGYSDGFLGYASNKYQKDARALGTRLNDQLIIQKVSNGRFNTLEEWKKEWFKEVKQAAQTYFKPVTVDGVSYRSYEELVNGFATIIKQINSSNTSQIAQKRDAVYNLKAKIYKKWLQDTNGFQENTIGNQ